MSKTGHSRREFFLHGGAVLGAGVATAAAVAVPAAAAASTDATPRVANIEPQFLGTHDHAAIRELQRAFMAHIEAQHYEAVMNLFDDHAHLALSDVSAVGRADIWQLFTETYCRQSGATFHRAYRDLPRIEHAHDELITASDEGRRAHAIFQAEVELCTPLSP